MQFLIIFGACTIVFGAVYVISTILTKRSFQGVGNWPKTVGEVQRAFVYRHERRTPQVTSVTYTPVVEYIYTVGAQRYTAQRRDWAPYDCASYDKEQEANAVVAALPKGSRVAVRYNENVPQQSVLKAQTAAHNTVFFGMANIIMGALMIVWRSF